ncbi:MAG: hypothetical protein WD397_12015 [Wenzhouxiangellaceae bacterium]
MNLKSIALVSLLVISIGSIAALLYAPSTPSDPVINKARDVALHPEPETLSTSPAQADSGTASIPPPTKEYDGSPPQFIIDAIRPYVREFELSDIYCVIEIGKDTCRLTLTWEVAAEYRPGRILVYNNADELMGSGWSGSLPLKLRPGEHTYILSYLNEKGQNHLASSIDTVAANASGDILGPDQCEISSAEDDTCQMDIQLAGFASRVILYNFDHSEILFELDAEGLFRTTYRLDSPTQGIQIGLFSNNVSNENLLAQKSITVQPAE